MGGCGMALVVNPKEEPFMQDDSASGGGSSSSVSVVDDGGDYAVPLLDGTFGHHHQQHVFGELEWDYFAGWDDEAAQYEGLKEEGEEYGERGEGVGSIKAEEGAVGFWDQKNDMSLNLNLNYQEVIEAWSDRGPLWADQYCSSVANANSHYGGEVPTMEEEEERERRRARVLKYREKRHCRLYSKKIRYEVRRINAEKRPRLKGRFVKRSPDKVLSR